MTGRQYQQINSKMKARLLTVLVFLVYSCCYIGRLNYPAAMTELLRQGILTKTQGGIISTVFFLCYGIGQLVNGYISDRIDSGKQITLGLLGSAILNLAMSQLSSFASMLVIWSINGYMQSLIWAPSFLIVSQSIPLKWRGNSLMYLNMAPPAGTILSFFTSALVLHFTSWKWTFTAGFLSLTAIGGIWIIASRKLYCGATFRETDNGTSDVYTHGKDVHLSISGLLAMSGTVCLIIPTMLHGMLRDGITNWLPTYLAEVFHVNSEIAVFSSVVLPLINSFGAAGGYFVLRRVKNEFLCIASLFFLAAISLLSLVLAGNQSMLLTVFILALVTACMMGVNTMVCTEVATKFAAFGKAGGISGVFDAVGYFGTAISMYVIAFISEKHGWQYTQIIWFGSSVGALLLCLSGLKKWNEYLHCRDLHQTEPY